MNFLSLPRLSNCDQALPGIRHLELAFNEVEEEALSVAVDTVKEEAQDRCQGDHYIILLPCNLEIRTNWKTGCSTTD